MDLFVLILFAASTTVASIEAAPQYYYPPHHYYGGYYHHDHYNPLQAPSALSRQERLKPEEIMDSAKEYAKMTRSMADFIDTKGPDFLSLLGENYAQQGNGPFPRP